MLYFREHFSFPVFLVGNHICTSRYLKCVCVCVRVCVCETRLKDSATPSVLVLSFPENSFMPVGSVLSFPENS